MRERSREGERLDWMPEDVLGGGLGSWFCGFSDMCRRSGGMAEVWLYHKVIEPYRARLPLSAAFPSFKGGFFFQAALLLFFV